MAKVLTIGGVFFKSEDPKSLCAWYEKWLQFKLEPDHNSAAFKAAGLPESAYAVWAPFPKSTFYFAPGEQQFMLNLMVDDLDGALAQVEEGGAERVGEIEECEYGRFGWFLDPEGNKVELWQLPQQ